LGDFLTKRLVTLILFFSSATEIGTTVPEAVGKGNYQYEGVACYVTPPK
jgi:hypothetical protein